MFALEDVNV